MANAEFWNDRFSDDAYIYGTSPNDFLAEVTGVHLPSPPATVVDLGAGEGRTAVYLAREGYDVTAVDASEVGLRKTLRLAEEAGVEVETSEADLTRWTPGRTFDAVVCAFLHFAPEDRPRLYRMMQDAVRPGGTVAAEWFRPEQRTENRTSGGPPEVRLMITAGELRSHFPDTGIVHLDDAQPTLDEGHHQGLAETVRLVWKKG